MPRIVAYSHLVDCSTNSIDVTFILDNGIELTTVFSTVSDEFERLLEHGPRGKYVELTRYDDEHTIMVIEGHDYEIVCRGFYPESHSILKITQISYTRTIDRGLTGINICLNDGSRHVVVTHTSGLVSDLARLDIQNAEVKVEHYTGTQYYLSINGIYPRLLCSCTRTGNMRPNKIETIQAVNCILCGSKLDRPTKLCKPETETEVVQFCCSCFRKIKETEKLPYCKFDYEALLEDYTATIEMGGRWEAPCSIQSNSPTNTFSGRSVYTTGMAFTSPVHPSTQPWRVNHSETGFAPGYVLSVDPADPSLLTTTRIESPDQEE